MTTDRTIDYDALAQDAMRGVVRTILTRVAKSGLPGDHHFYISFNTLAPNVTLSKRLREKYPEEMTIVLQHRFWDLSVSDDRFEVKLTFDGIPERLVVPFAAVKVFFDPSVRYGLQFESPELAADAVGFAGMGGEDGGGRGEGSAAGASLSSRVPRNGVERKMRTTRKPRDKDIEPQPAAEPEIKRPAPHVVAPAASTAAPKPTPVPAASAPPPPPAAEQPAAAQPAKPAGAQVVSLDAFRKK